MYIELKCNQLPGFMRKVNTLPSELILVLKIDLAESQSDDGASCQIVAPLLGTLKQPHRLKELTFVLPKVHYFLSSDDWIILQQFTGLKRLSIGFDSLWAISDNVFDRLHVLSELVSLEICNTQFGALAMKSLLKSLSQLKIQNRALDYDNLTDHTIELLAKVLSNSMYELESLSLRYNLITEKGIKTLVKALKLHSKFYSLDLSGDRIKGSEGLETLKELSSLRILNLTKCDIDDADFEMLANALATNKNLHFLNLSGNPFIGSETGLAPLANLTSLHQLDITDWSNDSQPISDISDQVLSSIDYNNFMDLNKKQVLKLNEKRDETLTNVLKHLTQLRLLNLCSKAGVPIRWSHELASTLNNLSELQLLNAPCLRLETTV